MKEFNTEMELRHKLIFNVQARTLNEVHDLIVVKCNQWFGGRPWVYETYSSPLIRLYNDECFMYEVEVNAETTTYSASALNDAYQLGVKDGRKH